jgi:peroxiredoxin
VKRMFLAASLAATVAGSTWAQAPAAKPMSTTLKVGDMAPDFTLASTAKTKVTLSDFRGKKTVVLAFFPAAFTGG